MRSTLGLITCAVGMLLIDSADRAHALTVVPRNGTQTTHFVVYENNYPPGTVFIAIDSDFIRGQSDPASPITFPCALDTVCSTTNGCNGFQLSLGTHIVQVEVALPDTFFFHSYPYTVLARDPVLLVPGLCGDASDWDTFEPLLVDSGFVVSRFPITSGGFDLPPKSYVALLKAYINFMDCDKVAVVAHSMGGLTTRAYMAREAQYHRVNKVTKLVTVGTPHHGSDLAARSLDLGAALDVIALQGTGQRFDASVLKQHLACQADPQSVTCLVDLSPGSDFLNRLNYGPYIDLFDADSSHGWDSHNAEVFIPGTYYGSIAGTETMCLESWRFTWASGGLSWHANDGAVAIGSAMLTNAQAFRALDVQLPTRRLTHTSAPLFCGEPYLDLDTLAGKTARILKTSPTSPPVSLAISPRSEPASMLAVAEDSLLLTPAVVDTIAPGVLDLPTRAVPATTLMRITLMSKDARLTLRRPDGVIITPADTSAAAGIKYFGQTASGFEGYRIERPQAGTWTFRVDASSAAVVQQYGCLIEYATPARMKVAPLTHAIYDGDPIRVRAELAIAGVRQSDVTWTCRLMGPSGGSSSLVLADDGAHGDSLAGDGIYGNVAAPGDGFGLYRIGAIAALPSGQSFSEVGTCELVHEDDLSVPPEKYGFSPNLFSAGDVVTIYATIRNTGSRTATNATVVVRDRSTDVLLGTVTVTVPANGEVMIQVPWRVAAPNTHDIEVVVEPYVFEEETNYDNNVATHTVILGTPAAGVGPEGVLPSKLWFAQPLPNPSNARVTFAFTLPGRGKAALELFDVLGRRIRRWIWEDLAAGSHTVEWDGRIETGVMAAPGLLLCRLSGAGESRSRKLLFRPGQ